MPNIRPKSNPETQNPAAKNPGRYPLTLKFGVLAASLFVPLLAAELLVRILYHEQIDTEFLRAQNRSLFIGDFVTASHNPDLLYTLKPGVETEWMGVTVATHKSHPIRIPTLVQNLSQPAIRIALIGDSMAFGWGMNYENTYSDILRGELEQSLGVPVELKNYSVPGYNSLQERIVFENTIVKDRPDIVILSYTHNDPDPTATANPNYIPPDYGDNFLHSSVVKLALRTLRLRMSDSSRQFENEEHHDKFYNGQRYGGPFYDTHIAELHRFAQIARDNDILPVAFNYCPYGISPSEHYDLLHVPFKEKLEDSGFVYYDAFPDHRAFMTEEGFSSNLPFLLSKDDPHPNATGHEFAATLLHNFLTTNESTAALFQKLTSSHVSLENDPSSQPESANKFRQAVAMNTRGEFAHAILLFTDLAASNPENPAVHIKLAEAHEGARDFDKAEHAYLRVLQLQPGSSHARRRLGLLYLDQNRLDDAIDIYEQILESDAHPRVQSHIALKLGILYFELNRLDEARATFARAGKISGDANDAPDLFIAELYVNSNKIDEALPLLEKVVRDTPNNMRARATLTEIYWQRNQHKETLEQLFILIEDQPNSAQWLSLASWILAGTASQSNQAIEFGLRAVELSNQNNPHSLRALSAAYANAGLFDEAVSTATTARDIFSRGGNSEHTTKMDVLIEKYKSGQPHRF